MLEPGHKLGVESRHKRNFKHDPLSEESRDLAKLHGRGNTWHHNVCCAHTLLQKFWQQVGFCRSVHTTCIPKARMLRWCKRQP